MSNQLLSFTVNRQAERAISYKRGDQLKLIWNIPNYCEFAIDIRGCTYGGIVDEYIGKRKWLTCTFLSNISGDGLGKSESMADKKQKQQKQAH